MIERLYKSNYLFEFSINFDGDKWDNFITVLVYELKSVGAYGYIKTVKIPVKFAPGYAIKINKKSCSNANGARGLFSFISDCIKNDFMMVYVYKIISNFTGVIV